MREAFRKLESCIKLNKDKTEWVIFNGCAISKNVTLTVGEQLKIR